MFLHELLQQSRKNCHERTWYLKRDWSSLYKLDISRKAINEEKVSPTDTMFHERFISVNHINEIMKMVHTIEYEFNKKFEKFKKKIRRYTKDVLQGLYRIY